MTLPCHRWGTRLLMQVTVPECCNGEFSPVWHSGLQFETHHYIPFRQCLHCLWEYTCRDQVNLTEHFLLSGFIRGIIYTLWSLFTCSKYMWRSAMLWMSCEYRWMLQRLIKWPMLKVFTIQLGEQEWVTKNLITQVLLQLG